MGNQSTVIIHKNKTWLLISESWLDPVVSSAVAAGGLLSCQNWEKAFMFIEYGLVVFRVDFIWTFLSVCSQIRNLQSNSVNISHRLKIVRRIMSVHYTGSVAFIWTAFPPWFRNINPPIDVSSMVLGVLFRGLAFCFAISLNSVHCWVFLAIDCRNSIYGWS